MNFARLLVWYLGGVSGSFEVRSSKKTATVADIVGKQKLERTKFMLQYKDMPFLRSPKPCMSP